MPGLNFIQGFDLQPDDLTTAITKGNGAIHLLPWHRLDTMVQGAECFLNCLTYDGYPIFFSQTSRHDFLVEGYFYGINSTVWLDELNALADWVFADPIDSDRLTRWLLTIDGEFVIWLRDRQTGSTAIVNDIFGRLPIYFHQWPAGVAVSRDIRFVQAQQAATSIDRLSMAHFVLLGHALDDKTLFDGVRILTPATVMVINPRQRTAKTHQTVNFDFSRCAHSHFSRKTNAGVLCDLFQYACRSRAGLGTNDIVSLSGGLDSRTVAAGLRATNKSVAAVTFSSPGYKFDDEAPIARQVARHLNIPWHLEQLSLLTTKDALTLLRLKSGHSPLYMGFILPFFEALRRQYGPGMVYFTGDGGDKYLPMVAKSLSLPTVTGLIDAILQDRWLSGFRLGLAKVSRLTGIGQGELRQSIAQYLTQFPETTWIGKYLHYKFYGHSVKLFFEAEDRNRCYFWSTTPFYGNAFFLHAINCPQSQKSGFGLYRDFLYGLSPVLERLPLSGYHGALGSPLFKLYYLKKRMIVLRPTLTLGIKKTVKRGGSYHPMAVIHPLLHRQIESTPGWDALLDPAEIKAALKPSDLQEKGMLDVLLNLLSVLEDFLSGQSSLETFPEAILSEPLGKVHKP